MGKKTQRRKREAEAARRDVHAQERIEELIGGVLNVKVSDRTKPTRDTPKINDYTRSCMNAVRRVVKEGEKEGHPIDRYFHHEHYLSSCQADGEFMLLSHFVFHAAPRGQPHRLSFITGTNIRCQDNIRNVLFMPSTVDKSSPHFLEFVNMLRDEQSAGMVKVSYSVCTKLIKDCLLRMKKLNRVLQSDAEKIVVRLYGLSTTSNPTTFHQIHVLPQPRPAPDVESLWLMLHRPEYLSWSMQDDLNEIFAFDSEFITKEYLKQSAQHVASSPYRRERMHAMMHCMALWHALSGDFVPSSWLLWEVKTIQSYTDESTARERLENNVVFQFLINKFFRDGGGLCDELQFPEYGKYGIGMSNYLWCRQDLTERGTLPTCVVITGTVAPDAGSNLKAIEDSPVGSIKEVSKSLLDAGCVLCGVTATPGRKDLQRCSRCHAVRYCSKEHQVLHWKEGGHKEECVKKRPL